MWVSVDLCVVPIGVGVSLSPYIAACERVIAAPRLYTTLKLNTRTDRQQSFAEKVTSVEQLLDD